jgi:chaperonin cofactor prefoldin
MKETVIKAVTDAFIELKLSDIIDRLDRRVSILADRFAALETRQPTYEDTSVAEPPALIRLKCANSHHQGNQG